MLLSADVADAPHPTVVQTEPVAVGAVELLPFARTFVAAVSAAGNATAAGVHADVVYIALRLRLARDASHVLFQGRGPVHYWKNRKECDIQRDALMTYANYQAGTSQLDGLVAHASHVHTDPSGERHDGRQEHALNFRPVDVADSSFHL